MTEASLVRSIVILVGVIRTLLTDPHGKRETGV
jgi:hypothetical protein